MLPNNILTKVKSSPDLRDSALSTSFASFPIQTNTYNRRVCVRGCSLCPKTSVVFYSGVPGPRHPAASRHLQLSHPV